METGGMKGRRKEIIREELHQVLCSKFHTDKIHSEYGIHRIAFTGLFSWERAFQSDLRHR